MAPYFHLFLLMVFLLLFPFGSLVVYYVVFPYTSSSPPRHCCTVCFCIGLCSDIVVKESVSPPASDLTGLVVIF